MLVDFDAHHHALFGTRQAWRAKGGWRSEPVAGTCIRGVGPSTQGPFGSTMLPHVSLHGDLAAQCGSKVEARGIRKVSPPIGHAAHVGHQGSDTPAKAQAQTCCSGGARRVGRMGASCCVEASSAWRPTPNRLCS